MIDSNDMAIDVSTHRKHGSHKFDIKDRNDFSFSKQDNLLNQYNQTMEITDNTDSEHIVHGNVDPVKERCYSFAHKNAFSLKRKKAKENINGGSFRPVSSDGTLPQGGCDNGNARKNHDVNSDMKSMECQPDSKRGYKCVECKYVTDRKNNLKRHVITMHEQCGKSLECCEKVFANKAALREHVVSCHKHGYDCGVCGRNFCRKALLKRHITVHSGQKDYVCHICGYATSHKSNLDRHKKRHMPKESQHFLPSSPSPDDPNMNLHDSYRMNFLPDIPSSNTKFLSLFYDTYSTTSPFIKFDRGASKYLDYSISNGFTKYRHGKQSRRFGDKYLFRKRLFHTYNGEQTEVSSLKLDQNENLNNTGNENLMLGTYCKAEIAGVGDNMDMSKSVTPEVTFEQRLAKKSRLFPRLHRCAGCEQVFQTQIQLVEHELSHDEGVRNAGSPQRPLTLQFAPKESSHRRFP